MKRRLQQQHDGLVDYVIPAIKMIQEGEKHTVVFHKLANKLNVSSTTVNSHCTRDIGLESVKDFNGLINNGMINEHLKKRFPHRQREIDLYL